MYVWKPVRIAKDIAWFVTLFLVGACVVLALETAAGAGPTIDHPAGIGVRARGDCAVDAPLAGNGPGHLESVAVVAEGVGRCDGWLIVETASVRTWVDARYVVGYESAGGADDRGVGDTASDVPPATYPTVAEIAEGVLAELPTPRPIVFPTVEEFVEGIVEVQAPLVEQLNELIEILISLVGKLGGEAQ